MSRYSPVILAQPCSCSGSSVLAFLFKRIPVSIDLIDGSLPKFRYRTGALPKIGIPKRWFGLAFAGMFALFALFAAAYLLLLIAQKVIALREQIVDIKALEKRVEESRTGSAKCALKFPFPKSESRRYLLGQTPSRSSRRGRDLCARSLSIAIGPSLLLSLVPDDGAR